MSTTQWQPSAREVERRQLRRRAHRRGTVVSTVATVVVIAVVLTLVLMSPGWPRFRQTFLSWHDATASFSAVIKGFWLNVRVFLVAEVLILVLGGAVAVVRTTTSPWLTPFRLAAVAYTDVFRGLPTILVVTTFGLGVPALRLTGLPKNLTVLGTAALVLCYGAYVAEVIRAGIRSIHPSQVASAQALALSRAQTMRFVVLPQAIRRVVPPLLNDFVSLQKDTALLATIGVFEASFAATDYGNYHFNYTPSVVAGLLFLALTIPLARVTDWLAARAERRERGR